MLPQATSKLLQTSIHTKTEPKHISQLLNNRSLAVVRGPDTTHTWPSAGDGLVVTLQLVSAGITQKFGLLQNLVW